MEQLFIELETQWMTAWRNKDEATARKSIADEFTLTCSLSQLFRQFLLLDYWIFDWIKLEVLTCHKIFLYTFQ